MWIELNNPAGAVDNTRKTPSTELVFVLHMPFVRLAESF